MEQDWSDSRLPWLDIVLVRLDGVGLKRVSWAVMCLDKPQWRAVALWGVKINKKRGLLPNFIVDRGQAYKTNVLLKLKKKI